MIECVYDILIINDICIGHFVMEEIYEYLKNEKASFIVQRELIYNIVSLSRLCRNLPIVFLYTLLQS